MMDSEQTSEVCTSQDIAFSIHNEEQISSLEILKKVHKLNVGIFFLLLFMNRQFLNCELCRILKLKRNYHLMFMGTHLSGNRCCLIVEFVSLSTPNSDFQILHTGLTVELVPIYIHLY